MAFLCASSLPVTDWIWEAEREPGFWKKLMWNYRNEAETTFWADGYSWDVQHLLPELKSKN